MRYECAKRWVPSTALAQLVMWSATAVGIPVVSIAAKESVYQQQAKLIRAPQSFTLLGDDLFGDKVNLYTGALEFVQTDVNVPGNSSLPVSVGRRLVVGQEPIEGGLFGGWDLEIPHIHGFFAESAGWKTGPGPNDFDRCTSFGEPPAVHGSFGTNGLTWDGTEYWHGSFLYIPGQGDQEMLRRSGWFNATPGSAGRAIYPVVTRNKWAFRCLPTLKNGAPGEGFVAVSPDGTEYQFDWMVTRGATILRKVSRAPDRNLASDPSTAEVPPPKVNKTNLLSRVEVWILPTKITDRHGNTVIYTYDPQNNWQLQTIVAAESSGSPRTITLTYAIPGSTVSNLVSSVSDGMRTCYGEGSGSRGNGKNSEWRKNEDRHYDS